MIYIYISVSLFVYILSMFRISCYHTVAYDCRLAVIIPFTAPSDVAVIKRYTNTGLILSMLNA